MDKIIRRTEYIKSYRARRILRERAGKAKLRRSLLINQNKQMAEERKKHIEAYRIARREDWFLGPLAPRRDVGQHAETYGTLSTKFLRGVKKIEEPKKWGIVAGDRVVVTGKRERERGKIGIVRQVRKAAEEVVIERVNLADVAVPPHLLHTDPDKTPTRTIEFPLPLSSIRLLYPLPDPKTGRKRDTIIESLTIQPAKHNDPGRYVTGRDIRIPWPPRDKRPEPETHPSDTDPAAASEVTWIPTLIHTPIPSTVIDELRNKYSKYRDRHDASYVEYHERRAAKEERREARRKGAMMSPMEEWRSQKEKEIQEMKLEPSKDLLEGIGRVMAQNNGGWKEWGEKAVGRRA